MEASLMSPIAAGDGPVDPFSRLDIGSAGSSASEQESAPRAATQAKGMHSSARRLSHTVASYSGNENASFSDFSDTGFQDSSLSLNNAGDPRDAKKNTLYQASRPQPQRNASQLSGLNVKPTDDDRVMFHGWLYLLKSKGGVRQWKSVWVVLRPKTLALYKNEEEYSATLILPFSSILDAVDIDPISKSKRYCMQIITEERNYRFCATNEDQLAKWLGSFKSLLVKRKERQKEKEKEKASAGAAKGTSVIVS
ncbi:hypothetical protein LTS18_009645 [Coniosporium uncinatum]|uniref:Uncharacterized protein n=1 Tax=Coniosporium uncinatum TaxID=93489 RepID=A0ACC3D0U4_9PEZI|nr:hypothetical protein LTS18_009645 [Coniosporium uncinatum]